MSEPLAIKDRVREFWESSPCGAVYARGDLLRDQLECQTRTRYSPVSVGPTVWVHAIATRLHANASGTRHPRARERPRLK